MRQEVIKELELITDEEKRVLSGEKQQVVWDIYSSKDKFEVDAKRLIKQYTMGLVFLQIINRIETAHKNTQLNYHDILIETTMRYIDQHYRDANLIDLAEDICLERLKMEK